MNIRDLHYLVTAAETEHFGQAAERCHVSQPTLSGQIRKLEETLGVALFERSHRRVVLTDAGREIAAHARQILDHVQRLEALAHSRQNPLTGDLCIGIIPTLCAYLLPYFLLPLQTRYPGLHPVIIEETTSELIQRLQNHDIDVALLATAHDAVDLAGDVLFEEPLWLAVSVKHALAERHSIGRQDLDGLPILTLAAGHCLADRVRELCGIVSAPAHGSADLRATSLETLLQLVAAGHGVTLVPALAVEHAPQCQRHDCLSTVRLAARMPADTTTVPPILQPFTRAGRAGRSCARDAAPWVGQCTHTLIAARSLNCTVQVIEPVERPLIVCAANPAL